MALRSSAPVAQLDRVPDYESGGCGFESLRARHSKDNEMMPRIISFLLYLGAFSTFLDFVSDSRRRKNIIRWFARKVRAAYR